MLFWGFIFPSDGRVALSLHQMELFSPEGSGTPRQYPAFTSVTFLYPYVTQHHLQVEACPPPG